MKFLTGKSVLLLQLIGFFVFFLSLFSVYTANSYAQTTYYTCSGGGYCDNTSWGACYGATKGQCGWNWGMQDYAGICIGGDNDGKPCKTNSRSCCAEPGGCPCNNTCSTYCSGDPGFNVVPCLNGSTCIGQNSSSPYCSDGGVQKVAKYCADTQIYCCEAGATVCTAHNNSCPAGSTAAVSNDENCNDMCPFTTPTPTSPPSSWNPSSCGAGQHLVGPGNACSNNSQCSSPYNWCNDGRCSYCAPNSAPTSPPSSWSPSSCGAGQHLVGPGNACSNNSQCSSPYNWCNAGRCSYCEADSPSTGGGGGGGGGGEGGGSYTPSPTPAPVCGDGVCDYGKENACSGSGACYMGESACGSCYYQINGRVWKDENDNGKKDGAESFTDCNKNGVWDAAVQEKACSKTYFGWCSSGDEVECDGVAGVNPNPVPEKFTDKNGNGKWDAGEQGMEGLTVTVSGSTSKTDTSEGSSGHFYFYIERGNYQVALTVPPGYKIGTGYSNPYSIPNNLRYPMINIDFPLVPDGSAPPPPSSANYTISGTVFTGGGADCSTGATPYTGGATVSLTGGSTGSDVTDASGNYSITASSGSGDYYLNFLFGSTGYFLAKVKEGSGPCKDVSGGYTYGPFAFGADIPDLKFYFSNVNSWYQTSIGDVRMGVIANTVPGGKNASSDTQNPSVFYSSKSVADFGAGSSSSKDWVINSEYNYNSESANRNGSTSYSYYKFRTNEAGVVINTLTDAASVTNLDTGVYEYTGDLTLRDYQHKVGQRVVLLVNGNVRIETTNAAGSGPQVADGFFIVAAKGDVIFDRSLGTTTLSSTTPGVDGIYTAERSIIIDGQGCSTGTPDKRLNIAGSLVANATKPFASTGGGKVILKRSLCTEDANYPSLYVTPRIDFITKLTDFYKVRYQKWTEVQP